MKKFKDFIITIFVALLLFLAFITGAGGSVQWSLPPITYGQGGMKVLEGITTFTIAFLGIVTIFDLCQAFGWNALVPTYIAEAKDKKAKAMIKDIIDTYYGEDFSRFSELLEVYFEKDLAFTKSHHQAQTDYIMQKLGINHSEMLDSLLKLRVMHLKNEEDAIARMQHILKGRSNIIVKQKENPADRTYKEVRFYIDFVSSMRDDEYGKELSKTFARYILLDMKEEIKGITKVVIPADSNFLLGFKVAETLGCPPVIMREKRGRIYEDRPWDGELSPGDTVIIVHDVLVSGDQVVAAMKKLRDFGVKIRAVYCIVNRLEYPGEEKVIQEDGSCQVRAMLELNDQIIEDQYYKGC